MDQPHSEAVQSAPKQVIFNIYICGNQKAKPWSCILYRIMLYWAKPWSCTVHRDTL